MYIILGATGHVGSVVAQILLELGEPVTIVTHNPENVETWEQKGARVAIADVHKAEQLRTIFTQGTRLFLLNPPAPPATDTDEEERKSVSSIIEALRHSGIEKVVALSTYGAQPGDRIGDLGVLYELEQKLANMDIPTTIVRAAYYMSNWDMALSTAQEQGTLYTLFPPDLPLPMIAPYDIGQAVVKRLREPVDSTGLYSVEGPQPYSSVDVAKAFERALQTPVSVVQVPQEQWIPNFTEVGFSPEAAESMAAMTSITIEAMKKKNEFPDTPERGTTTLDTYIHELVTNASS